MFKPDENLTIAEQHDQILGRPEMAATIKQARAEGMTRKAIAVAITRRLNEMGYGISEAKVAKRVSEVIK